MIEWPYSVAGFAVGAIVGLTGVGGGSLMTPLLVLGFGVAPVTAVGTDLLYAGFTKVGGAVSHGLKGHVDWRITGLLAREVSPARGLRSRRWRCCRPPARRRAWWYRLPSASCWCSPRSRCCCARDWSHGHKRIPATAGSRAIATSPLSRL